MQEKKPKLSVVIPTLNRKECLERTVISIVSTQRYSDYEIIIIDQSDKYDPNIVMKDINSKIGNNIFLKYFIVNFKSLPKARNLGIQKSAGEIILFLDDDIGLETNLFQEHIQAYSEIENLGGIAGRVIEPSNCFNNSNEIGGEVTFLGRYLRNFNREESGFVLSVTGANMSFRKVIIDFVGLFDERFIGTSEFEEVDYSYRLRKAGYRILYNHKAKIKHFINPDGGCRSDFLKRQFYKMHNLGLFFAKHKPRVLFPLMLVFQFITIVIRTHRNVKEERVKICFEALRGLLTGYLVTSKIKRIF